MTGLSKNVRKMPRIRKITIGRDYKDSMAYELDQSVWRGSHTICDIVDNGDEYHIFVTKPSDSGAILWKQFNKNMGISIEFDVKSY